MSCVGLGDIFKNGATWTLCCGATFELPEHIDEAEIEECLSLFEQEYGVPWLTFPRKFGPVVN